MHNDEEEYWESHEDQATSAVDAYLEGYEVDPIENRVGLDLVIRGKRDPISWFSDFDSLADELTERIESELIASVPTDGGAPIYTLDLNESVGIALEERGIREFFETARQPDEGQRIFDPRDFADPEAGIRVRIDVEDINDEVIRYLSKHPEKMRNMNPRKFEELVAEVFRDKGYDVQLTPASADGGKDIICAQRTDFGTLLFFIECKRYAADRPVGVDIVRALYGVMAAERATKAMVATTSRFTKGAREFHEQNKAYLSLSDFDVVAGWLRDYKRKSPGGLILP